MFINYVLLYTSKYYETMQTRLPIRFYIILAMYVFTWEGAFFKTMHIPAFFIRTTRLNINNNLLNS